MSVICSTFLYFWNYLYLLSCLIIFHRLMSFIILFKVPIFDLLSSLKLNCKSTRVDIWFYRVFFTTLLGSKAVFLAFLGLGGITLFHPSFREGMYPYSPHMLDIPWARCLSKLKMSNQCSNSPKSANTTGDKSNFRVLPSLRIPALTWTPAQ